VQRALLQKTEQDTLSLLSNKTIPRLRSYMQASGRLEIKATVDVSSPSCCGSKACRPVAGLTGKSAWALDWVVAKLSWHSLPLINQAEQKSDGGLQALGGLRCPSINS